MDRVNKEYLPRGADVLFCTPKADSMNCRGLLGATSRFWPCRKLDSTGVAVLAIAVVASYQRSCREEKDDGDQKHKHEEGEAERVIE